MATNREKNSGSWIFDSGATDTMTFELSDMSSMTKPQRTQIHTANGGTMQVKGGGTIEIVPTMTLSNCLYVPSLSHKLLSISHVTKELNCTVAQLGEHTEAVTTKHTEQVEPTTSETATEYTEHVEPVATETTGRYALPPRANRGVPPKRYSPEKEARSSKYPMANVAKGNLSQKAKAFVASLYSEATPTTVEQALKSKNWKEAMKSEMDALRKNDTWEKCIIPEDKKPVGCRWVFTIKHNPDGTIERYKARLVAKGYTQTYGIDYSETFSPVAKINTIRVLFSIAANKQWPLHQFDVKNAFLHGELEEEVYMEAPPGFTESFKPGEVCRLKKSLYGLKQSPRAWFGRFTLAMKKYGFKQSNSDHTLFLKQRGKLITCLIIYVDDMIVTGNDEEEMKRLKANLFSEFEMKDLGRLKYFLGIEVLRSNRGIFICQKKYILDLLAETGMIDCKPSDTPMIMNQKLCMEEGAQLTDRDWAGDKGDRRSTSGYFTLVGGNLVTWRSKKQKVVALSSAEAEFRGIARGLTEVLWVRKLLTEIGFPQNKSNQILCDNKAAIQISENPVQHDRTKHIEVDRNFIKEKIETGVIELPFVRSEDQLADILTKAVNGRTFSKCLGKLNVGDPTIQLEGEC
ncbi:putative RNA-directed DNA polymerase [Helianthus debilis subsp. tardiflorus]